MKCYIPHPNRLKLDGIEIRHDAPSYCLLYPSYFFELRFSSIQTNLEVIRLSIVPSPLGTTRLSLVYSFTGGYNQYQVMDLTDPDTGGKKNRYQALWNLWSRITHQTLNMLTLHQCLKLSFLTQPELLSRSGARSESWPDLIDIMILTGAVWFSVLWIGFNWPIRWEAKTSSSSSWMFYLARCWLDVISSKYWRISL